MLKCLCVGCSFNKNAYILTKRALSSSLSKYGSACPASEQCTAATHTSYSRASNDQAAMSVHERVKSYSGNLALATQHDRAGIYSSIQMQTTPFQWRDIASKCPGSETRDRLSARERSSRASPTKRAGERFLQPRFCGTQKGWGTPPNSRSQTHQQSALQTSVQDDNAETFSKCMDAALSPLRASGMRILNYLDDWLILAQSRDTLLSHINSLFIHMESLGLCVNMQKNILAPSQSITYLGVCLDSVEMRARLSRERAAAILSSLRHVREGSSVHSEAAGTQGVSFGSMSSGLITHAPAAAMAEISSPQDSVDFGTFEYRGHLRLHRSSDAVAQPRSLQPGSSPGLGSVAHGGHDGRIDSRLGSSVRGNASFGTVVGTSEQVAHKPLGAGSSLLSPKRVSDATGTAACTDSLRQNIRGFVHKSPGWHSLQGFVQAGNESPAMGGLSPPIHQSSAHPQSPEPRGRHAFEEGDPSREMEVAPESVRMIWNRYGRAEVDLFATSENAHCPLFFSLSHSPLEGDALTSHWPAARLYGFPPIKILPLVLYKIREERASVLLIAPNWPNQPWIPDLTELLVAPPWPIPVRKDMLSQADGSVWHSNPELWSLHVWLIQGYQRS